MVSSDWWPSAPPQQRQHAIAARALVLPDGTWWLFGAWARWYRLHPSDGQWHLCPPPQVMATRMAAAPARNGWVPGLPPHVVPAGPDFGADLPAPLPFVGRDLPAELTARIRATVESAAELPAAEYPHLWASFSPSVPSTVALAWGVMLWCAAAPVFDSRLDDQMLGLWAPYRGAPLPAVDGPRWLTPPTLADLVGLYAERLRAGRVDAAVVVLRTMWAIAGALRTDVRFRARADALLAILGATLNNPTVDYGALSYGDQAVVQQWLTRCPPHLAPALRIESSAGDHFRHTYYALAEAIAAVAGDPAGPAYIEPRLVAAAFIAADLAVVRQSVVEQVVPWLDPEIRYSVQAVLGQSGHPLRRLWPADGMPPGVLRGDGTADGLAILLAAMYGVDLAWCRLGGGIPARPRGFPVPTGIIARLIGPERARGPAPEPPAGAQYPAGDVHQQWQPPGGPGPQPWEQPGGRPPEQGPAWWTPAGGPQGGAASGLPDAAGQPYVQPPALDPAYHAGRPAGWSPAADATRLDDPAAGVPVGDGPRGRRWEPEGTTPEPPHVAPPANTKPMSETMVGDFEFLDETPVPERPVDQIAPPPAETGRPVTERYGMSFVSGAADAAEFLDELRAHVSERPDAGSAVPPSVLLVGSPHTGQRRMARLIARTLADAGFGDGAIRLADADDVRGATAVERLAALLAAEPALLFERLDAVVLEDPDPAAVIAAVRRARLDQAGGAALIATCAPRAYRRLVQDHPEFVEVFQVFRLPDLTRLDRRLTLLHVLADERRVTVGGAAMEVASEDLTRLHGPGELLNARLVETYLEQACQRHVARSGASQDRLVLVPADLAGVAEAIEPALRPPGDVDGFLSRSAEMVGLAEVKRAVEGLAAEARLAADRAYHGLSPGNVSRHLIFLGPPGTGKTTVAGLVGGIYAALGLLDSGHIVACGPAHLTGRDDAETESRVAAMVEQAMGGVLLLQQAHQLGRSPEAAAELLRCMSARRGEFMVVCTGRTTEMEPFLAAHPGFRAEFGTIIEFAPLSARELVRVFQLQAERDLYMLEEELRVELLARFERMRSAESFQHARTVRAMFEQTVARQGARLAGADVDAAAVARLIARDLPDSTLEQMLGDLHKDPSL
jgi:DNA polymerase III delta prime subunit